MDYAFSVTVRKTLPKPRSKEFLPMFSSGSLITLHDTFRSMTHFELIFL